MYKNEDHKGKLKHVSIKKVEKQKFYNQSRKIQNLYKYTISGQRVIDLVTLKIRQQTKKREDNDRRP